MARRARKRGAKSAKAKATNLSFLARRFGNERWREVIRLYLAMVTRPQFETFMREVVSAGLLKGNHDYTSVCLRESLQPSEEPFVAALADAKQRYAALKALHVLRELNPEPMRRLGEQVNAKPDRFFGVPAERLSSLERDLAAGLYPWPSPAPERVAPAQDATSVFISYSRRDGQAVQRIRLALEGAGIRVWLDTGEINPGQVIARRIEEGVAGSTRFLPVLSRSYFSSEWARLEENLAWQREVEEKRVVVVPVLLEGDLRSLPLRYRQRRFVDLRDDFDTELAKLADFLRKPRELPSVRINPADGTELVLVPAGKFEAGDGGRKSNPPREIDLPAFYLARYPVTNAQYAKYLSAVSAAAKPEHWNDDRFNQPDQPAVGVSWREANAYCEWAGLRLPEEWEWEKGARGIDGRAYPWGTAEPTPTHANFGTNVGQTSPVGSYPRGASPYGLMDMAGNVWEWTASLYGKRRDWRTVRGGSFSSDADSLRASCRRVDRAVVRLGIGFRCAQDP